LAEAIVVLYIAVIAALAQSLRIPYLLFPELGALAYDVFVRPWGRWASQPLRLVLTPTLTAVLGTLVTRHLDFSAWTAVLIAAASIAVIGVLRSSIIPGMSAGILPLVLGMKSWLYPPSILLALSALSALSILWRRYHERRVSASEKDVDVEDVFESPPKSPYWMLVLLAFVAAIAELARIPGLRFLLFPPLVTMAYEMFGHADRSPWTQRPVSLPLCCFLSAGSGLLALRLFGAAVLPAVTSIIFSIAVLRFLNLHMPPAMAIGLLPAVMVAPDYKFPVSVLASTLCLTLVFLGFQRFQRRTQTT
jgi:uncharacterized membrane protein YhaH (DUF805 family)